MNGPGYCELCGRTGPVTADDVARTPDYWTAMTLQGYPNICGTGLGIRLAKEMGIPIYNLKRQRPREILQGFERIQQFQRLKLVSNDREPGE